MKTTLLGDLQTVMSNPHSKHNYFGWPTVCRLKNGRLAAVASGFRLSHVCPFGKTVISFSEDEGKTWTAPAPVFDTPLDDRDGGICAFGQSGVIVTSFNNTAAFQRSRAVGIDPYRDGYLESITMDDEQAYHAAAYRVSFDNGVTFGPIYKVPIIAPHGPIELNDGTILMVGHGFNCPDPFPIEVYQLGLDGKTQHLSSIPLPQTDRLFCEPHCIQLKDGTVLCHIRVQQDGYKMFTLYETRSGDGGRSWSTPKQLLGDTEGAPAHLMYLKDGTLLCSYGRRNAPYDIRVIASKDHGQTWSEPVTLYSCPHSRDLGYPSTVELKNGDLLTVFYAHPEEGAPALILSQKWRIT